MSNYNKKEILCIGFDVDKTLYEPNSEVDLKINEYICRKAASTLQENYEDFQSKFYDKYLELQSASKTLTFFNIPNSKDIVQEALENADIASALVKDNNLIKMFNKLYDNYKLFIITGSNLVETHKKFAALGISPDIFSILITSDDKAYRREDHTAFKHISEELQISYDKMMFVGDRENIDIIPASKIGITTAIVNSKSKLANYELEKIYDIETILDDLKKSY